MEHQNSTKPITNTRPVAFEIDLNETPLPSPREIVTGGEFSTDRCVFCGEKCVGNKEKCFKCLLKCGSEKSQSGGGGGLGLLDINASPPREADGVEAGFLMDIQQDRRRASTSKMQDMHGDSFAGNTLNSSLMHSQMIYIENRFTNKNASSSVTNLGWAYGEKLHGRNNAPSEILNQTPNDVYLDSLREFISALNGVLEEGWRVDFVYSSSKCKTCAVYCAPDGSRFDSLSEVAHHLGLVSKSNSLEAEDRVSGISLLQKGSYPTKRTKEGSRSLRVNNNRENNNMSLSRVSVGIQAIPHNNGRNSVELVPVENGTSGSQPSHDGFPFQFEDFFVNSVGKIDPRLSYHSTCWISPVGYKAIWHDKIMGSLFVFTVLDGGDSGPIYRIDRCPCTKHSLPNASTVLCRPKFGPANKKDKVGSDDSAVLGMVDDDDIHIQLMLADHSPPCLYNDNSSCSNNIASEESHLQKASCSTTESGLPLLRPRGITSDNFGRGDIIGEFAVEGKTLSSAWEKVVKTLLQACHKAYKDIGVLQFCCNHNIDGQSFNNAPYPFDSLAKFCYLSGPINSIPDIILSDDELDASCELLAKWLQQDRFGLDVDFVQELVEQLPGVTDCSEYRFLNKRCQNSTPQTVGNGFLVANRKNDVHGEKVLNGFTKSCKRPCPSSKPLTSMLPLYLIGDVLQACEFSWRFSEVLGLETHFSLQELEYELINPWLDALKPLKRSLNAVQWNENINQCEVNVRKESNRVVSQPELPFQTNSRCTGVILENVHTSLLKVLIGELVSQVVGYVDPNFGAGESKSRRGRKKDVDNSMIGKKTKVDMLPINEITWPELARRYILAVLSMEGNLDSTEIAYRESGKVFCCLQGDGGTLCGSLTGVTSMEADAVLLAEATRKIFGPVKAKDIELSINNKEVDPACSSQPPNATHNEAPEWAQVLQPVRKLPTNVGARIRRCINEALDRNPPEWAKKILLHSISKEVYKGNASGPTKRAVVSVLEDTRLNDPTHKEPEKKEKEMRVKTVSDVVMKRCRIVLRRAAAADDERVFCNLLGRTLLKPNDNDDEGLLGYPAMVSRPLDFRTIDLRLAAGVYDGSHEAFAEDVREVWQNIHTAYGDRPDLTDLVEKLSKKFEQLYEEEVLTLVHGIVESATNSSSDEAKKELNDMFARTSESSLPKAPWEDGVCKVCGMDKDDDNVLLCDTCDSEYHTYCLDPPLARIPEGNWYCPSCLSSKSVSQNAPCGTRVLSRCGKKRLQREFTQNLLETLAQSANMMELKEYWDLTVEERVFLIKFLCDEALSSAIVRDHLEQCASASADLQQKLRSLTSEWKTLKLKEDILAANLAKAKIINTYNEGGELGDAFTSIHSDDGRLLCQLPNPIHKNSPLILHANSEDGSNWNGAQKQYWSFSKCAGSSSRIHNDFNEENGSGNPDSNDPVVLSTSQASEDTSFVQENVSQGYKIDAGSLKNEISSLQDSITTLETESIKVAVRKEFLGRDCAGRLYWGFGSPGTTSQRVIVNGSWSVRQNKWKDFIDSNEKSLASSSSKGLNISGMYAYDERSSWTCYRSDVEIDELIGWLRDDDVRERELKETIVQWQKHKSRDANDLQNHSQSKVQVNSLRPTFVHENALKFSFPETKARVVLQKKFGSSLEQETIIEYLKKQGYQGKMVHEGRMYRCDCLELVGPSRHHCLSCHLTFCTSEELEGHGDGKCKPSSPRQESSKSKSMSKVGNSLSDGIRKSKKESRVEIHDNWSGFTNYQNETDCPFRYDEIRAKFSTRTSLKEVVKGIGLISSNGTPSFVSEISPHCSNPTFLLKKSEVNSRDRSKDVENQQQPSRKQVNNYISNEPSKVERLKSKKDQSAKSKSPLLGVDKGRIIRQSALIPLVGSVCEVLRWLKINLLDMDTALPEEALRPSRGNSERRSAWRAFVKSAQAIYEMVQATIILEDMIKTEYLKNDWWYWSSPSAAAKISTVSALALRIYALDAAIIYEKLPSNSNEDTTTESIVPVSKSEKESSLNSNSKTRKSSGNPSVAMALDLDPAENSKPKSRPNKRRKDSAG